MHSSKYCLFRLFVICHLETRTDETCSRCTQMQKQAAGRARFAPIMSFVAVYIMSEMSNGRKLSINILMSHQTRKTIRTLPAHMIVFIPEIIFMVKNQPMMQRVATFRARQCHGRGNKREMAAKKAIGGNSGCMARCQGSRKGETSKPTLLTHLHAHH